MFKLQNLSFRNKLIGGFTMVLVLLVAIALQGFVALDNASSGFVQYREMARDANLAGRLQANMLMVRMNVKDFIITGSDKDLEQYGQYLERMNEFLTEAKKEIQQPERAEKVTFIAKALQEYIHAFEKVVVYKKQRNHMVHNKLNVDGPIMEKDLTAIMMSAERDQDIKAAYHAGLALRNLLLGRLYVVKFLDTNSATDAARVATEFSKLEKELATLDNYLENPERRKLLEKVDKKDHEYHQTFIDLTELIHDRNDLIAGTLDRIGPEVASKVEEVKLNIKGVQDEIGPVLQANNQRAVSTITAVSIIALLAGAALVFFITRSVAAQLGGDPSEIADVARSISQGNLSIDFRQSKDGGTTGVYHDMEIMADNLKRMFTDINTGVETLTTAATELSAISEQMTQGSQNVSDKSNAVSVAAEEMSSNMNNVAASMEQSATNTNMVATAAEEMSTTIQEIAQNAEKAKGISDNAASKVSKASTNMGQLGDAANTIGKVIETITDISEQVNLLALNATIEAARAGEAGKGFAVVANEIKDLAKQTAEATGDIREKIEGIQGTTSITVGQISEINEVIIEVNGVVTSIASAVEQQSAATKEIADNVAQASQGIQEVNENVNQSSSVSIGISKDIAGVSASMGEMSTSSSQVSLSAQELSQLSENLKRLVEQFKI